jgi:hypothetical protein
MKIKYEIKLEHYKKYKEKKAKERSWSENHDA